MFARSTTFKGQPGAVEAGSALVRDEIAPALQRIDGCVGVSMLVDRESGGCVITSAWESETAMQGSEQRVGPLRDRAQQVWGDRPEVRRWEIAVLHRLRPAPAGACARVTWSRAEPGEVDAVLDVFRTHVLPRMEDLPGFCSSSVLVDRGTGDAAVATTYESRAALERSREAAMGLRSDAAELMTADIVDVAEFEVVLAHLRVPETV